MVPPKILISASPSSLIRISPGLAMKLYMVVGFICKTHCHIKKSVSLLYTNMHFWRAEQAHLLWSAV